MSEGFVRALAASELAPGAGRAVVLAGRRVALFRLADGGLHAIDDACPHHGASLAGGSLEGCAIMCPWHAWTFDVRTGAGIRPSSVAVRSYEVRVEGDDVLVRLA